MLSLDEARARILAAATPVLDTEAVPTAQAGGRILAQAVLAQVDVPPLDNAQMDGYAVRCADLAVVPAVLPVALRIAAGQGRRALPPASAARIFTGAPIPEGSDAVLMQEAVRAEGNAVAISQAPAPGQWIRRRGSDIAAGSQALAAGQALRAQHLGIAASVGAAHLTVVRRLRVALFCTGDELIDPGQRPEPGKIYNSNRFVLGGLLHALGCEVIDLGIVRDSLEQTRAVLQDAAARADVIVSSGGVSVGEEDHVREALKGAGSLELWQIAMKPGKPLAFGRIGRAAFLGLPGNPVAGFVTFALIVRPFLLRCLGVAEPFARSVLVRADFERPADDRRRELLRVRRNENGGLDVYSSQNSALLSSVAWADGLADIGVGMAVRRGDLVPFIALSELTGPP